MENVITTNLESVSKFGLPNSNALTWYWFEIKNEKHTGICGRLKATTEMEALDRLRECFKTIRDVKWVSKNAYYLFLNSI